MSNKKIIEFEVNINPTLNDVLPIVNNGNTKKISLSGLSETIGSQHWLENNNRVFNSTETLVISENLLLKNSNITLLSDSENITLGNLIFNKYAQIFIGGYLLMIDSNIVNDGLINVAGGIILSGNSTITGTGILI